MPLLLREVVSSLDPLARIGRVGFVMWVGGLGLCFLEQGLLQGLLQILLIMHVPCATYIQLVSLSHVTGTLMEESL
jgi:hypothetical protein